MRAARPSTGFVRCSHLGALGSSGFSVTRQAGSRVDRRVRYLQAGVQMIHIQMRFRVRMQDCESKIASVELMRECFDSRSSNVHMYFGAGLLCIDVHSNAAAASITAHFNNTVVESAIGWQKWSDEYSLLAEPVWGC